MNKYWNGDLFYKVVEFAMKKHDGQKIMLSKMPYIGHVFEVFGECVAACLEENISVKWDYLMMVAMLHDTLEDTDCTIQEIVDFFGVDVANGVKALTKDEKLPYQERIQDSLNRIILEGQEVALIKMADRIVNLQEKPTEWDSRKLAQYKEDSLKILNTFGHNSKILSERLKLKIEKY